MAARMNGRAFFGRRLRVAREQKAPKMSRRALAEQISLTDSAIAAWESGRNVPDPKTLVKVERALGSNGLLQDIVDCLVTGEKREEYMGRWAHVEAQASTILRFSFDVVPGLLQTEDYAKAILRDEGRLQNRLERQKVMARENPPVLVALIDESILHRNVGGPAVMRDQLRHLREMGEHEYIIIHVIRLDSPVCSQYTGPFSLASSNGEAEIAFMDDAISGGVVENPDEVARLRRMFEILRGNALSEQESIRLIEEVEKSWLN